MRKVSENKKYFVVKDRNDLSITYFEYDKVQGYDLHPRNVKIKDAIDVNQIVVINPGMMEKLAFRKVNAKFRKIVKLLMFVLSEENDDDGTGGTYQESLNEISKLRMEILVNYKNKLRVEDFDTFNKKLDLLEQELKMRLYYLQMTYPKEDIHTHEGKSR